MDRFLLTALIVALWVSCLLESHFVIGEEVDQQSTRSTNKTPTTTKRTTPTTSSKVRSTSKRVTANYTTSKPTKHGNVSSTTISNNSNKTSTSNNSSFWRPCDSRSKVIAVSLEPCNNTSPVCKLKAGGDYWLNITFQSANNFSPSTKFKMRAKIEHFDSMPENINDILLPMDLITNLYKENGTCAELLKSEKPCAFSNKTALTFSHKLLIPSTAMNATITTIANITEMTYGRLVFCAKAKVSITDGQFSLG